MQLLSPFNITITIDRSAYTFHVTHLTLGLYFETFLLKRGNREIVIESNRPLFRNRGIKRRIPNFKVVKGDVKSQYAMEVIAGELMKKLE